MIEIIPAELLHDLVRRLLVLLAHRLQRVLGFLQHGVLQRPPPPVGQGVLDLLPRFGRLLIGRGRREDLDLDSAGLAGREVLADVVPVVVLGPAADLDLGAAVEAVIPAGTEPGRDLRRWRAGPEVEVVLDPHDRDTLALHRALEDRRLLLVELQHERRHVVAVERRGRDATDLLDQRPLLQQQRNRAARVGDGTQLGLGRLAGQTGAGVLVVETLLPDLEDRGLVRVGDGHLDVEEDEGALLVGSDDIAVLDELELRLTVDEPQTRDLRDGVDDLGGFLVAPYRDVGHLGERFLGLDAEHLVSFLSMTGR